MLARMQPRPSSARNVLDGHVLEVAPDGALSRVTVGTGATTLVAIITQAAVLELGLARGDPVVASIKATAVHLC
jgi:molybdate transport system ATP-binding protein